MTTFTRRTEDSGHAKDMDVDKPETSDRQVNADKVQPSEFAEPFLGKEG